MQMHGSNLHHGYDVEDSAHYYEVELTPRLRAFMLRMVGTLGRTPARDALVDALEHGLPAAQAAARLGSARG